MGGYYKATQDFCELQDTCEVVPVDDSNWGIQGWYAIVKPGTTDNIQRCDLCHETCWTCNGNSDIDCTSCQSDFVLFQGQCVRKCGTGTYYDPSKKSCVPSSEITNVLHVKLKNMYKNFIANADIKIPIAATIDYTGSDAVEIKWTLLNSKFGFTDQEVIFDGQRDKFETYIFTRSFEDLRLQKPNNPTYTEMKNELNIRITVTTSTQMKTDQVLLKIIPKNDFTSIIVSENDKVIPLRTFYIRYFFRRVEGKISAFGYVPGTRQNFVLFDSREILNQDFMVDRLVIPWIHGVTESHPNNFIIIKHCLTDENGKITIMITPFYVRMGDSTALSVEQGNVVENLGKFNGVHSESDCG
jgi:hypothetical protein